MTSSTGCSGIDAIRIATERHHRVAHGRQVDDAGHAGEVLEQDARRHERDFLLDVRCGIPVRERPMSSALTKALSSRRSRFSRRIFMEYGSRETPVKPAFSSAGRLYIWTVCPPTRISVRVLKLFRVVIPIGNDTSLIRFQVSGISFATSALEVSVMDQNKNTQQGQGQQQGRGRTRTGTPSRSRRATRRKAHATSREATWEVRNAAPAVRPRKTAVASPTAA